MTVFSDFVYDLDSFFFPIVFIYLVIFGCAGSSLLHDLFSSCSEWGLLSHCSAQTHCSSFSCCGAWALGCAGSAGMVPGPGAQAWLLRGLWDLLGSGIRHMSLALAGRFFTTEPVGEALALAVLRITGRYSAECHPVGICSMLFSGLYSGYGLGRKTAQESAFSSHQNASQGDSPLGADLDRLACVVFVGFFTVKSP